MYPVLILCHCVKHYIGILFVNSKDRARVQSQIRLIPQFSSCAPLWVDVALLLMAWWAEGKLDFSSSRLLCECLWVVSRLHNLSIPAQTHALTC